MENPYTKEQILRIVERKFESSKVDYKLAYPIGDREHQCEVVRDIIAISNTIEPDRTLAEMGFDPGYGFIIIGSDERGGLHDISAHDLDDEDFQKIVNERVEPPIEFLFVTFPHDFGGQPGEFGALIIPPSKRPPHRVSKDYVPLRAGYCAIRRGTRKTQEVSDADLEDMFRHRALYSDVERKLQQEEFRIGDDEIRRLQEVYVQPGPKHELTKAEDVLRKQHFLLIHGKMGVGKRTTALWMATHLLNERSAFRIIRVSRFTPLGNLRGAEGSVIIIPDAFGLFRMERLDIEKDRGLLEELIKGNFVVMTSTTTVLDEVLRETRLDEWDTLRNAQLELTADSYARPARRELLQRHLAWAVSNGRVQSAQASWLSAQSDTSADDNLQRLLDTLALPIDIKRFVDDRLPKLTAPSQLTSALREMGSIQKEIRTWFNSLDDDQQCFLFALALFDGFNRAELFEWYRNVVEKFRVLNPRLAIHPLERMSQATEPYIQWTQEEKPAFAHPSFYEAILQVVTDQYREHFSMLVPDFLKASLPLPDKPVDDEVLRTQPIREAISFAAGKIAQKDLETVLPLVEAWATHRKGRVRLATTEVLGSAAANPIQIEKVLGLLRSWTNDRSQANVARRWTSAVTYGRLGTIVPDQALYGLAGLVADPSELVRSGLPKAVRSLTFVRPTETQRQYKILAADSDTFVRREVSRTLKTLSFRQRNYVLEMLNQWRELESAHRLWTLARVCFILPRSFQAERTAILAHCVDANPSRTAQALADALKEDDTTSDRAWAQLEELLGQDKGIASSLPHLAATLEAVSPELSWERISKWAISPQRELRVGAAHVLSVWKSSRQEQVQPLLEQLTLDEDPDVATAAQLEATLVISLADLGDDSDPLRLETDVADESIPEIRIWEVDDAPSDDIQITILSEQ